MGKELLYKSHWLRFLGLHCLAFVLVASWLFPPTRVYWDMLDVATFRFLNESIESSPITQLFWAIANVKLVDVFGAIYIASFFLLYVFDDKEKISERLAQFLYLCIWGEIGILCSKEAAIWLVKQVDLVRESPSVVLYCPVLLSQVAPWLSVKDFSRCSFPSDHAMILFQWASFVWFFCGTRRGIIALISATFFSLPRLIAGAHWLTDVVVGSMSIIIVVFAWATCTPLYRYSMILLTKLTKKFTKKREPYVNNLSSNYDARSSKNV